MKQFTIIVTSDSDALTEEQVEQQLSDAIIAHGLDLTIHEVHQH